MRKSSILLLFVFSVGVRLLASQPDVREGKTIYESILRKYPGLTLYLESGLTGENARLVADVPASKWKQLSTHEQRALAAYVQSELSTVRSDPARYSLTPTTAPIWPTHRASFQQICDSCWEIHIGRYDQSTKSLGDEGWTVAMKGNAAHESTSRPVLHESNLQPLSASNAAVGAKLYNEAGAQEATIVGVDIANDRIRVQYGKSGNIEPKQLSAVAHYRYIRR